MNCAYMQERLNMSTPRQRQIEGILTDLEAIWYESPDKSLVELLEEMGYPDDKQLERQLYVRRNHGSSQSGAVAGGS